MIAPVKSCRTKAPLMWKTFSVGASGQVFRKVFGNRSVAQDGCGTNRCYAAPQDIGRHRADSIGRRNTPDREVAMSIRKKRSTRARLGSLGRPPVAGRAEQELFWRGIAAGLNSEAAALKAGLSEAVGPRLFRKAGGIPPAMFRPSAKPLSGRYLSLAEREESFTSACSRSMI